MGRVIEFPRLRYRHARASSNVNNRLGASCPRLINAASKTKNLSDGILRRERQLLTAAEVVRQSPATVAVPPSSSITSSTVRSMPDDYSQIVNSSSPPGMEIVTFCEFRSHKVMGETRQDIIRRLRAIGLAYGIDDAEICRRIDVKPSRWANFMSPKDKREITRPVAYKVCDEFTVTLDWIYRGKTARIPQEILDADRKLAKAA